VLPGRNRITRGEDFARVIRHGVRAGRSTLVVHLVVDEATAGTQPRAGFVVSKAVGGSVVRHRVVRRLRHAVRDRLDDLPAGAMLVVRALPSAATAGPELVDDLTGALRSALKRGAER